MRNSRDQMQRQSQKEFLWKHIRSCWFRTYYMSSQFLYNGSQSRRCDLFFFSMKTEQCNEMKQIGSVLRRGRVNLSLLPSLRISEWKKSTSVCVREWAYAEVGFCWSLTASQWYLTLILGIFCFIKFKLEQHSHIVHLFSFIRSSDGDTYTRKISYTFFFLLFFNIAEYFILLDRQQQQKLRGIGTVFIAHYGHDLVIAIGGWIL